MRLNIVWYVLVVFGISVNCFAKDADIKLYEFEEAKPTIVDSSLDRVITIKSNGKIKSVAYPKQKIDNNDGGIWYNRLFSASEDSNNNTNKGIILSYGRGVDVNIDELESKYNISFVKKLGISYYQFDNNSNYDDATLISKMIEQEKNIKDIRPNWRVRMSLQ